MTEYLKYKFQDTPEFVETFDEVPLWSASFGLLLLKHVELKPDLKVVDIGSGAGFPLIELAERLGNSCKRKRQSSRAVCSQTSIFDSENRRR